jgi:hypothetical protein
MAYGVTPYPVSPLASLLEALTSGVQSYNQAAIAEQQRKAQQQALEMQRQQMEMLRAEEARQAQAREQQAAAQALQMGQWAQTAQGWQMLQNPEYQEQFRRAGGALPIQSQQVIMPQGVPTPAQGSAPISAVSAVDTKNTYKLPEKPEDLWTVEEWYAKNGLAMPDEAKKYAKVPAKKAKDYGLWSPEEKQSEPLATDYFPNAPQGMPYKFFSQLPDELQKKYALGPDNKPSLTYREWGFDETDVEPQWLDKPAPPDEDGLPIVMDYMKPKAIPAKKTYKPAGELAPDVLPQFSGELVEVDPESGAPLPGGLKTHYFPEQKEAVDPSIEARKVLDSLSTEYTSALKSDSPSAAVRAGTTLKNRLAFYERTIPGISALYPEIGDAKTIAKAVTDLRTSKSSPAEEIARLRLLATQKALGSGVDTLNDMEKILVNADGDPMLEMAIRTAQSDMRVLMAASKAGTSGKPADIANYQKVLTDTIGQTYAALTGFKPPTQSQPGTQPKPKSQPKQKPSSTDQFFK